MNTVMDRTMMSNLFKFLTLTGVSCLYLFAFEIVQPRGQASLEGYYILRPHAGKRTFTISVHVHQALKGTLLTACEEPVDRALLISR